ncbi:MAG: enoyl-CoA hydratase/isomerase family protein [Burkholderiaceae bacterium]
MTDAPRPVTMPERLLTDLPAGEPIASHDGAPVLLRTDAYWHLRLARPAEHNRLDPADVDSLLALFDKELPAAAPRALVISGTGGRSFSSGYTLSAVATQLDNRFARMLDTLESLPCLTIAALNGSVYGGATDLALCCDIRLGCEGMRLFMPAATIGLHYYPGGLRRYVTRLGLTAASKLMLTGMTVYADELLRIGFLTELLSPGLLEARLRDYLEAATANESLIVAQMKAHMHALADRTADTHALTASMEKAYLDSARSGELQRRLKAVTAKR